MTLVSKRKALLLGLVAACCAPIVTGTLGASIKGWESFRLAEEEKETLRQEARVMGCDGDRRPEPTYDDCRSIASELQAGYYVRQATNLRKWAVIKLAVAALAFAVVVFAVTRGPRGLDGRAGRTRA